MDRHIKVFFLVFFIFVITTGKLPAQEANFKPKALSLEDCISLALKTHPKIIIYGYQTDQKKQKLQAITAGDLPQVGAVASYDRLSVVPLAKQRYLGDSNNDYQADIVVTQPLYAGGKITAQKNAARYAIKAAEHGYLAAKEEVIFDVKAAYYKLLFSRDILKNKEDLLKYAQSSYDTALDLHKRTKLPREETLLRLEVQLNEIRQELITAQGSLKIAQKTLLNTMGLESNDSIEVQDLRNDLFSSGETAPIVDNYEVLKLSEEIKEAAELVKIARSSFYPRVTARYSYGYEWGRWSERKTDWIAGVAVDLNLWDWGKTKADVKQAQAHKEELRSYEKLLGWQISLELESARLKYETAANRSEIARTSFEQAQRSLDLFTNRYRDASATSIELLDAQKAFAQAQANYALSILDLRLAKADIEKLRGRSYELK